MRRFCLALGSLVCLTISAPTYSRWFEHSSENFVLYSDMRPRQAERLLTELEKFRYGVLLLTNLDTSPESAPAFVFAPTSHTYFRELVGSDFVAGIYLHNVFNSKMVVGPDWIGSGRLETLFHEYVHHLMANRGSFSHPYWYDEGFAEMLAYATIRNNALVIGERASNLSFALRDRSMLPLEDLLSATRGDLQRRQMPQFYATSWLLTYYLQRERLQGRYREEFRTFMAAYPGSNDPVGLFEEAFGISVVEMNELLTKYLDDALRRRAGGFSMSVDVSAAPVAISSRSLSRAESQYVHAEAMFMQGKHQVALRQLRKIRKSDPGAAAAYAMRGLVQAADDPIQARLDISQALGMAPNDANVLALATWAHAIFANTMTANASAEELHTAYEAVIELGERAVAIDATNVVANVSLWQAYHNVGDELSAVKAMMQAYRERPQLPGLNLWIGRYLIASGRPHLAEPFIQEGLRRSHNAPLISEAQALLQRLRSAADALVEEIEPADSVLLYESADDLTEMM